MSKHNYSQYSNNKKTNNKPKAAAELTPSYETVVEEPVVEETTVAEVKMVEETVETVAVPECVTGTVVGCARLNIRETPNLGAKVLCAMDVGTELKIDVGKSTREWFYVCTVVGIEGFCMRKFVNAKL